MTIVTTTLRAMRGVKRRYRQSELAWHVDNLRPHLEYALERPALGPLAKRIVQDLSRDGIATTEAATLVDASLLEALTSEVARTEALAQAGETAATNNYKGRYRVHLLGDRPVWNDASPFVRLAQSPEVTGIASTYLGLSAALRYFNVWRTFPVDTPPGDSQLWHQDREDRHLVKVFLYLTDVTRTSGPLTYIKGTHRKGAVRVSPEAFREPGHSNLRSRDDQMEEVVPRQAWHEALGPRGTLVFVDTTGYHKGGFSRTEERLVYTCMFTSPASSVGDLFDRPAPLRR